MISIVQALGRDVARQYERDADCLTKCDRILLALRWQDWIGAQDLFDAMDIAEHERGMFSSAMTRLRRAGRVQWRGRGSRREYRLEVRR